MAVSGTHAFNPKLADQIDEAFERCGIDPGALKARHIRSAIRSANLVLTDWQNFGYNEYALVKLSQALTALDVSFVLPVGGYDIFHATVKRDSTEREMYPISRSDYNALATKSTPGMTDRYFVDHSTFVGDAPASTVFLYQIPENSTDTLEIYYIRKLFDAGKMQNTLDMGPEFYEAFACGMAFHLSRKFAPEKRRELQADYLGDGYNESSASNPGGALGRALVSNRDTADAVFRVSWQRARGR